MLCSCSLLDQLPCSVSCTVDGVVFNVLVPSHARLIGPVDEIEEPSILGRREHNTVTKT